MTASDAQGDLIQYIKTVTHTSNGKGKVRDTSNRKFEQKLLGNRTLSVVVPTMNLMIDDRIVTIVGASKTLLTPATKEVVADAASGGVWVNRNPRKVSQTGVDGITPCDTGHAVRSNPDPSPVLIVSGTTFPPCGLSWSLQVVKKRKSTSSAVIRNAQTSDAVVDSNLLDDQDSASIFSKVIGHKLSNGSSDDLYLRCRMNFARNVFQTEAPKFVDLGLPTINTLNESGVFGTLFTKI